MKKFVLVFCSLFLVSMCVIGQNVNGQNIPLTIQDDNNIPGANGTPKTPINLPEVSIYGHTLYFTGTHAEFVLTLTDEEDNVVFTTIVFETDTQIVLPSTLSGLYELRLYADFYCFVGEITL